MTEMVTIREEDLIDSVADALQFISYFHPMDYIRALGDAYQAEQGPAAKDAIAQILTNSRMCAEGHRPICQDTGIVNVFVEWGQNCRLESGRSLQEVVDEGVRRAYNHPENKLRASVLADPAFTRRNTRDNTPSVLHVTMVPGSKVSIDVAEIHGSFDGELTARSQLIIHATGKVSGKIRYGKLLINEGGELCGDINSLSADKSSMRPQREETVLPLSAVAG